MDTHCTLSPSVEQGKWTDEGDDPAEAERGGEGGSENAMWEESRSETSNRTERTEEEEFGGQLR